MAVWAVWPLSLQIRVSKAISSRAHAKERASLTKNFEAFTLYSCGSIINIVACDVLFHRSAVLNICTRLDDHADG